MGNDAFKLNGLYVLNIKEVFILSGRDFNKSSKPKKRNYSIVRYTSSDYVPLQKLDLLSKFRMTFRFLFDKKYKEVNQRKKRIQQERDYHDKMVVLKNFLNEQLASQPKAKKIFIQVDKKFLPVLDDVLNNISPEWFPTPMKINPNILKYIRVPHVLIEFSYVGEFDLTNMDTIPTEKVKTLLEQIQEILNFDKEGD